MVTRMNRRQFLKIAASSAFATSVLKTRRAPAAQGAMKYRTLGHTGEKVSIIGLGGFHIGRPSVSAPEGERIIRTAIDNGINFMDNSWDYNHGESELRMGRALRDGYREKVFLMTKIDGRNAQAAASQL